MNSKEEIIIDLFEEIQLLEKENTEYDQELKPLKGWKTTEEKEIISKIKKNLKEIEKLKGKVENIFNCEISVEELFEFIKNLFYHDKWSRINVLEISEKIITFLKEEIEKIFPFERDECGEYNIVFNEILNVVEKNFNLKMKYLKSDFQPWNEKENKEHEKEFDFFENLLKKSFFFYDEESEDEEDECETISEEEINTSENLEIINLQPSMEIREKGIESC